MGVFDTIDIQNLESCPNEEIYSGLSTKLFYAPASFFFSTPMPISGSDFESEILIDKQILMKAGKKLCYIDILIDENELKTAPVGNSGRKKIKTSLEFYILGFKPSVLGFLCRCLNEPLILFIQDSNGKNWQIGNLLNRAFLENFEGSSGKKPEDNSGVLVSATCNSSLLIYSNSLDHFAKPGDFNNDFNNDFYTINNVN